MMPPYRLLTSRQGSDFGSQLANRKRGFRASSEGFGSAMSALETVPKP